MTHCPSSFYTTFSRRIAKRFARNIHTNDQQYNHREDSVIESSLDEIIGNTHLFEGNCVSLH